MLSSKLEMLPSVWAHFRILFNPARKNTHILYSRATPSETCVDHLLHCKTIMNESKRLDLSRKAMSSRVIYLYLFVIYYLSSCYQVCYILFGQSTFSQLVSWDPFIFFDPSSRTLWWGCFCIDILYCVTSIYICACVRVCVWERMWVRTYVRTMRQWKKEKKRLLSFVMFVVVIIHHLLFLFLFVVIIFVVVAVVVVVTT